MEQHEHLYTLFILKEVQSGSETVEHLIERKQSQEEHRNTESNLYKSTCEALSFLQSQEEQMK